MPNGEDRPGLDPNPVDQLKDEWMLTLLGVDVLTKLRPPVDTEKASPGTVEGLALEDRKAKPRAEVRAAATLRKLVVAAFNEEFKELPAGARQVRVDELTRLREQFISTKDGPESPELVKTLAALNRSLREAFADVRKEIKTLAELRAGLRESLAPVAPLNVVGELDLVPAATAADQATAQLKHRQLLADIANAQAAPEALNRLYAVIQELGVEMGAVRQRVAERLESKARIEAEEQEVRLHPEAPAEALDAQRQAVRQALGAKPLDDPDLENAQRALEVLRQAANTLNEKTGKVVAKRDEYRKQLATTVEKLGPSGLLDAKALESGTLACESLLRDIQAESEIDKFPDQLTRFRDSFKQRAVKALENDRQGGKATVTKALKQELAALAEEAKRLDGNPNVDPALLKKIPMLSGREKLLDPNKRGGLITSQVDEYFAAVDEYRRAVQAARLSAGEKTAVISVDRDVLLTRVGKPYPKDVAVEFSEALDKLRSDVRDLLKDPLVKQQVDSARGKTTQFERVLLNAAQDVLDAAEVAASGERVALIFDGIVSGARKSVQAELKAAREAATQRAQRSGKARDMAGAKGLFAALEKRLQEAQQEALGAAAAKATYLQGVQLDGKAIDEQTLEDAYDLLGPGGLQSLNDDKGGSANIVTVCAALKAGGAPVRQFYDEALGGNAKAFANLVRGGDAKQLKELADAFQDGGDRQRFGALVTAGGLGDKPECLADLLNQGVADAKIEDQGATRQRNVERLKQLGQAFGDKSGPAALKGILVDSGLGARPSKDRPGVMAELLRSGCDGDPKQLRAFADEYAGADGEAVAKRKNLKNLVEKGGFGEHPSTLGPLLKAGKVSRLQDIGQAFALPTDAAKLRVLLSSGGMSGDTQEEAHKHEHPDTLAKVFVDGFGGSSARLKQFADAFQGQPAQCKEMLDAWNEYPSDKAGHRQPGKQIAKLLNKDHFNGSVEQLQKKFTTKMQQIPSGKRKVAMRMAPSFDSEAGPQAGRQPNNMPNGGKLISDYILERHSPKHAQKGMLDQQNSYFPAGTDDNKLAAIITEALNQPNAPTPGNSARVVCPTAGLTVEIAIKPDGNICHCFPTRGSPPPDPNEIVNLTLAESTAVFEAVK